MSYQLLKQDILFYQRFLKSNGFYHDDLDGSWGSNTNKADADFLKMSDDIKQQYGTFDNRSESNIISLTPKAQTEARKFLKIMKDNGKNVRIISGTRTYAEQNQLYAQGRNGNKLPKVTNAKGGQSNHNFGIAWDIGLFDSNGSYNTNNDDYQSIAPLALTVMDTLEWGGNWRSLKDYPHYQLKALSDSVAVVRGLFENGEAYT